MDKLKSKNPECDECLKNITTHSSEVIALFEIRADKLFDEFIHSAKLTTVAVETSENERMELHFKNQSDKEDIKFEEHLEKQSKKHDEYLDRKEKKEVRSFNVNMTIILILASVIGYSWIRQDTIQTRMMQLEYNIDAKPSKKEVPTMNELQMLLELGNQYNRSVFVRKDFVTADTSAYHWAKINTYGGQLRGAPKYYKEAYEKAKREEAN